MNQLKLDLPKKIQEAVPANLQCGKNVSFPKSKSLSLSDLHQKWTQLAADECIMDVRTPEEFSQGHIPGSLNIPMGTELASLTKIKSYQKIYAHCRSGKRVQTVLASLSQAGIEHVFAVIDSGMEEWTQKDFLLKGSSTWDLKLS